MQSGEPDPTAAPGSNQGQEIDLPRGNKRPREPSRRSPDADSIDAPSSSRSRPTLNQPPSQRGSSRDTNEMHRSTTPPEASSSGTIKYTRTGRVSKATKGQRVHHCEECGKTYTRAEHLRRHQQNHKPGAFPCDVPGCGRSFYREDLLVRHRARHNDLNNPPSRRHSVTSASDTGGLLHPDYVGSSQLPPTTTSSASAVAPVLQPDASDGDGQRTTESSRYQLSVMSPMLDPFLQVCNEFSLPPKRVPIPPNELCPGTIPLAVGGPLAQSYNLWQPASPRTPPCYDYESSDEHMGPYFQPQSLRARQFSDTSFLPYDQPQSTSRSPASAGSSTIYPHWLYQTGYCTPYDNVVSAAFPQDGRSNMVAIPYGVSESLPAEARDLNELQELATAFQTIADDDHLDGSTFSKEDLYLEAFWTWSHDLFPVIHRPTFHLASTSPLLRAAVLALGAQSLGGRDNLSNARNLHERSLKILKKRTVQNTHTYRVCDMQAILLVEVYSIFKSRRPPLQLSTSFERLYRHISNDAQALGLDLTGQDVASFTEDYSFAALEASTKQRILLSCYAFEQQHTLLFGRQSLDCLTILPSNLPFPTPQTSWDDWHASDIPQFERLYQALRSVSFTTVSHDIFTSTVMLNCLYDTNSTNNAYEHNDLLTADQSSRTLLTYNIFKLCKAIPVRAMLAVAGESWVMAEKMSSQQEYTEAQIDVSQWAKIQDTIPHHAFEILRLHQQHPRTGIMFQEFGVFIAAITIWAYAHLNGSRNVVEKEVEIPEVLTISGTKELGWTETRCILKFTKESLEKNCLDNGLISGALDVLGKLIEGGNEEARWF